MSHAVIVMGADAISRANILAKGKNCLTSNSIETPCGSCKSCMLFDSGNHPDTFYVKKTKTAGIGVDDVREQVITPMATKTFSYNFKVFIINKAETLTPAAQSALLKTIEEPAPYGFFLFVAPHLYNFLPTVVSRCHVYKTNENYISDAQDADIKKLAVRIVEKVENCDVFEAFQLYKELEPYKDSKELLQELLDLIYYAYGTKIVTAVKVGQVPEKKWQDATHIITKTKTALSQNGNTQLAMEIMLAKLAGGNV